MAITTSTSNSSTANASLLRLALQINGTFSLLSGIACVIGASWLATAFGLSEPLLMAVMGLLLIAFGGGLLFWTMQRWLTFAFGATILALDVLWVIGSFVVLFADWLPMTDAGRWLFVGQALVVALIADLEFFGLRRMRS